MSSELPGIPRPPSIDSHGGLDAWLAWWRTANDLARTEATRLLAGIDPEEARRRQPFEETIIRHKLTEPLSYQCVRGHFVKFGAGSIPKVCGKCGDATIEHCICGASILLTYTYKPPYRRVNPSSHVAPREACFGCSRMYPWAYSYLHRPTEDELSDYERQLLPFSVGFPERKQSDAERQRIRAEILPVPVNIIYRIFGFRVDVSDPRHPQHFRWLEIDTNYRILVNNFSGEILKHRQDLLESQRKLAQRNSFWRGLSGTEFEEHLADLLGRFGFVVERVGGKGDEGADIVIKGSRTKIIVQCKAYSKPVGPGPVRDLFGALMHHQADEAWLVSLEGFSDAAITFAGNKPIRLLHISALLGAAGKQFLTQRKKES